jgi:hypothetical protein
MPRTREEALRALELARAARKAMPPIVHLLRGSPSVRSWSKYKTTDARWTLCGIERGPESAKAVEDLEAVNCRGCLQLAEDDRWKAARWAD